MQDDAELAHGCRERPFLCFPPRQAPLLEGVDHRVAACGGERRHGQDRTDRGTPAAHMARAGPCATIVVEWGDPHPRRNVALGEHTSLRPRRVQGGGQHRSNPGSGWSQGILLTSGRAGADDRGHRLIRLLDQALEIVQMPREAITDRRVRPRHAMTFGDQHLEQWAPVAAAGRHSAASSRLGAGAAWGAPLRRRVR